MNEPFRRMSSLCELDSTRLSNIFLLRLRRQMDQGFTKSLSSNCIANIDLKYRLRSVNFMKGITAAPAIEHTEFRIWIAAVRDNSPARSTHHRRAQHSCFYTN